MSSIVERAKVFAYQRHGNQKRKYTEEPYTVHLVEVYYLVRSVGGDENMLAAALLHDVLEDTDTKTREVQEAFGDDVYTMVFALTDFTSLSISRRERKALDRNRLASSSPRVQTIKLADLIDNTSSIVEHDKDFARIYLDEKAALLEVLTKGDGRLRWLAAFTLERGQRALVQAELGKKGSRLG